LKPYKEALDFERKDIPTFLSSTQRKNPVCDVRCIFEKKMDDGSRLLNKLIFILLFSPPCVARAGFLYNFRNAGDYNNFIMKEMASTVQKNFEYISFSVHSDEYDQLESKDKMSSIEISRAIERIHAMPPLDGSSSSR